MPRSAMACALGPFTVAAAARVIGCLIVAAGLEAKTNEPSHLARWIQFLRACGLLEIEIGVGQPGARYWLHP